MWHSLISDEGATAAKLAEELKKNEFVIDYLTTENRKFKSELEVLDFSKKSLILKLNDSEKSRLSLAKDLKRAREEVKYETIAREGMVKKANIYEFENLSLKDEKKSLVEHQTDIERRIKLLEAALSLERARRLRDIHEIDMLKNKCEELERTSRLAEGEVKDTNKILIDRLQKTESIIEVNVSLRKVIDAQSEEMHNLMIEIEVLRGEQHRLHETLRQHEATIADLSRQNASLDAEVWRLRKEVVLEAGGQTQRSRAFHPKPSTSTSTSELESMLSKVSYMDDLVDFSVENELRSSPLIGEEVSQQSAGSDSRARLYASPSVMSPAASLPLPPGNVTSMSPTRAGKPQSRQPSLLQKTLTEGFLQSISHSIDTKPKSDSSVPQPSSRMESAGLHQAPSNAKRYLKKKGGVDPLHLLSTQPRTLYVSSGLGLRSDSLTSYVSLNQGSAKDIIRKAAEKKMLSVE